MAPRSNRPGAPGGAGCPATGTVATDATGSIDANGVADPAPPASATDARSHASTADEMLPSLAAARADPGPAARIRSEQLFRGAAELQIEHRGALYRLKQTSLGKLILTK